MASNMWNATGSVCDNCGKSFDEDHDFKEYEDGTPHKLGGVRIEDCEGNTTELCEECLIAVVRNDWEQLKWERGDEDVGY